MKHSPLPLKLREPFWTPDALVPAFERGNGTVSLTIRICHPLVWHLSVAGPANKYTAALLQAYWQEALASLAPPLDGELQVLLSGRDFRSLCTWLWSQDPEPVHPLCFWVAGWPGMWRCKRGMSRHGVHRVASWAVALDRAQAVLTEAGILSGSNESFPPEDPALAKLWHFMTAASTAFPKGVAADPDLAPLYEAVTELRQRLGRVIRAKKEVEKDLARQNDVHRLRADIWRIAADKSLTPEALIQKLLDKIGPFLKVSRACYNAYDPSDTSKQHGLVCVIEWCDQGIKPSLGTHIPPFLVKSLSDKPIFHITPESAAGVVPAPVQGIVRRMIEAITLPLDVRSLSVLPHKIHGELEGCFTFDICRSNPHHLEMNEQTRDVVQEMIDIINNHLVQKQAHAALKAAYDDLEDRVQARTADLARTNRELEQEIRERRQTEADLRQAKEGAEAANVAKSQFLANISHEIRTPLHAITGFTEIILRSHHVETIHEKARIVLRESGSLLRLIEDLLDQSRLESGRLELQARSMDLHQMLNHVESSQSGFAQQKGLAFTMTLAPNLPRYILADEMRLRQVLNNLIHNAIKFTAQGSVRLTVEQEEGSEPLTGPGLRFEVEDTGVGIPAEKIDTIFQRFTQVDGSMTRRFGGTGLGTTIAKQLVELMGGQMDVQSTPGRGSRFGFFIPLLLPPEAPPAETKMKAASLTQGPSKTQFRLLLVEDYPANQEVALMCLEDSGYRVDVAANGIEALAACGKTSYDLILMDVQMPEMDGYVATQQLRASGGSNARTPVVGITAHAGAQDRMACLDAGMDDVLTKPLSHDALIGAVGRWIGKRSDFGGRGKAPRLKREKRSKTVLDVSVLMREFGPGRDYRPTVHRFIAAVHDQIKAMRRALLEQDLERIWREAHAIKGGAATLAAEPLRSAAEALEERARRGGRGLPRALRAVEERFHELERFMEGH